MRKKIHFVGVKGVGIAPLAIIAKEAGFDVSGCDIPDTFITDVPLSKAGIKVLEGFSPNHVEGCDFVITTGAHLGLDNPEVKYAKEKGIAVLTHGEALAKFQDGSFFGKEREGISVAGSHGKTTTSAMMATVLVENKMDPSFAIGTGNIPSLGSDGHFGRGKYFVVEADEYANDSKYDKTPKFLLQNPKVIVVTNIDFDHPDIFESIDDIRDVFVKFTERLPGNGFVVACGDGKENRKFVGLVKKRLITYGFSEGNDYVIEKTSTSDERTFFWVKKENVSLGEFSLQIFGDQNVLDATAVIAASFELGLSIEQIKRGLLAFVGTKRRSEFLGKTPSGALLYDDYAHHPEEIKNTLRSFRKAYPKKRIVCVFQPHMYSRTKILLSDFIRAFESADEVIIAEIYPSFREKIDPNFSARILSDEINKISNKSVFVPTLPDVIEYIFQKNYGENCLIITMGAGDIYKISEKLLNK